MSYFVQDFRDFVTCRGETEESLKKKFDISPSEGGKTHQVFFGAKSVRYSKKDMMKALDHWRDAGKQHKEEEYAKPSVYSVSWEDLRRKVKVRR